MWLKIAYVEDCGVLLSNMGVLWWRTEDEKQHRKWGIFQRVVCLDYHIQIEKQEQTILHIFKLTISKESGESGEKRKVEREETPTM